MLNWFGRFITPEQTAPLWRRLLPYAVLVLAGLIAFAIFGAGWEYSNSNAFCGTSCHTMPPEYIAYQESPHANVKCVECHIGREFLATQFARKVQEITHVTNLIGANYEVPIYAKKLRPASEICVRCHRAEKFSDNSLREYKRYDAAQNNQVRVTQISLKTGGGTLKEGQGQGIHWHVENKVEFIANDDPNLNQAVAWVRVNYVSGGEVDGGKVDGGNADGGKSDIFTDINLDLPADYAEQNKDRIKLVDCMVCHNRISHLIRTPSDALDDAMARGVISAEIPYFKQNAAAVMERAYPSMEEARKAVYGLVEYYQLNWPDYYAQHAQTVFAASRKTMDIYEGLVFPSMDVSWETHPDNSGHKNSAGCFRCHNGSMINAEAKSIPVACTTCHSIPVQTGADGTLPPIETSPTFQPESHADSHWLSRHRFSFDSTCEGCHTVDQDLSGAPVNDHGQLNRFAGAPDRSLAQPSNDNSSFCANSACHASDWKYLKLDSPKLIEMTNRLDSSLPTYPTAKLTWDDLVAPILASRCVVCHGETGNNQTNAAGLNLTTYSDALAGSENGPVLLPGQAEQSPLLTIQRQGHPNQLPALTLEWIEEWIKAGAPQSSEQ